MDKGLIQDFARSYSIETTVGEAERVERFASLVPPGKSIYIPHIPGSDLCKTVELATRLRKEGMEPVPHIVARRIETLEKLDEFLGQLASEAGVQQVLTVAGDIPEPVGQLKSTLQILESGLLEKHGIHRVGVAGHPEGHKQVDEASLKDALRRKNAYAQKTGANVYVATQFTFSADPVIAWESRTEEIGQLPIMVGLPGLASPTSLLKFALECGVGASIEAFSKRASSFTRLLTVSTPDETLIALAKHKGENPNSRIAGMHFFPFGGFKRTATWINKVVDGQFELSKDGTGLMVS